MAIFTYNVIIEADTEQHAHEAMAERMEPIIPLDFDYTIHEWVPEE